MSLRRVLPFVLCFACAGILFGGCTSTPEEEPTAEAPAADASVAQADTAATATESKDASSTTEAPAPLPFPLKHNMGQADGQFIEELGFYKTDFYGKGEVRIEDGVAYLDEGNDMTGITWQKPMVRMNYEISLEAMRVTGNDFFCGLTFLYGNDPCSFIVGGWGGTCVGISSLDFQDAYNNETANFRGFNYNQWYKIRVRVTPEKIEAWIDDEQMVDVETKDRIIGIRFEVDKSRPLGVATWRTGGAIRNITLTSFGTEKPEIIDTSILK